MSHADPRADGGTLVQVFFGKGKVGKTTGSAATALALAESGEPTLVLSTDLTPSTIPETLGVLHLEDVVRELARYGLWLSRLVVNNVVHDLDSPFLEQKVGQQRVPPLEVTS